MNEISNLKFDLEKKMIEMDIQQEDDVQKVLSGIKNAGFEPERVNQ